MYFIPNADFPAIPPLVQPHLYSALECLRLASAKLDQSLEAYDRGAQVAWNQEQRSRAPAEYAKHADDETVVEWDDILELFCTCRTFGSLLEEIVSGVPLVSDHVLRRLRELENASKGNPPHLDGGVILARLAWRYLAEAHELYRSEVEGEEITADYELIVTAEAAIQSRLSLLEGLMHGGWDLDEKLDSFLNSLA